MTGDPFRKVTAGQPLSIPAAAVNAWNDLVTKNKAKTGGGPVSTGATDQTLARVKNGTGADLDRWAVVALREPAFTPEDAPDSFAENLSFSTAEPDESQDFGKFGILQGPLADGAIGRAVVSGITFAKIQFSSDNTGYPAADIADGVTEYLQPCMRGAASILWKEEGTGTKWAIVKISRADPLPYALDDCRGQKPTRYAVNPQLEQHIDRVVRIQGEGGCWRVRRAHCDEVEALAAEPEIITGDYDDCATCLACWKLTRCDDEEVIRYTNTDLAAYEDKSVKLDDGYCYEVERADNCNDAEAVTLTEGYEDCEQCASCYKLVNCLDSADVLYVTDNLLELLPEVLDADEPEDAIDSVFRVDGVCYFVSEYTAASCSSAEHRGITAEDWIDNGESGCTTCGCAKLTRVCVTPAPDPSEVLYVHKCTDELTGEVVDLHALAGDGVIRLNDGKLYTVEETEDCTGTGEQVIQEHYGNNSPDLCPQCFKLTPCEGGDDIKTYEDLKGLGYDVGKIVLLVDADDNRYCYTIAEEIDWDAGCVSLGTEEHPVGDKWLDERVYEDCDNCNLVKKYKLENTCIHEDCEGVDPAEDIITTTDLHAYVGKWVKYRGTCYVVSETEDAVTVEDLGDVPAFAACDECKEHVQTWSETVVTNVRAHAATFKLQMKQTTIQVTGASNCDTDGGAWIDINTGAEC